MVDKVMHLDDEQMSELVSEITRKLVATRSGRTDWQRRIQIVLGAAAIISLVFSLGVNWTRIANVETKISDGTTDRKLMADRLAKVEMSVISQEGTSNLITSQLLQIQRDVQDIKMKVYK